MWKHRLTAQRIVHISPTYYSQHSVIGGGEKYIIYMCRAITIGANQRGLDLRSSVLAFGQNPGSYDIASGIRCRVMLGRPWDPFSIDLANLETEIAQADVVVVHQCLSAFGLFAAAHSKSAKKFVVGVDLGGGEHGVIRHTPEVGRTFDLLHAISRFAASSYRDIDGRVEVIPGPIDTEYYQPDYNLPKDPDLVLAVGRILPHKGLDRVVRALPHNKRLIIAGSAYDEEYKMYLAQLAQGHSVEIRENVSDKAILSLMQTASVFVQASTHFDYKGNFYHKPELLGLAPLEALSAGTATIVSSAGSLPELAALKGCAQFECEDELASLLQGNFAESVALPAEMHDDVEERYGLATFGRKFIDAIYPGWN
jgi:glycosyltransferase involved in cell wall biosynthesis